MKILFVCTANIVRSFMAERILVGRLEKDKKTHIQVSSAGIIDMEGAPPDSISRDILHEHKFNGDDHISTLLTDEMVTDANMIIVMENIHREILYNKYPESKGKIYLLKSFSRDYSEEYGDIKDPYKLSIFHYRLCFAEIYMAIDGVLKCI